MESVDKIIRLNEKMLDLYQKKVNELHETQIKLSRLKHELDKMTRELFDVNCLFCFDRFNKIRKMLDELEEGSWPTST